MSHQKPMKKEAWSVACVDAGITDCGFYVREHDKSRMVKFMQDHAKATHNFSPEEKNILSIAKRANW